MDTKDKEPFFQEYNQPFQISIHIAIYKKIALLEVNTFICNKLQDMVFF